MGSRDFYIEWMRSALTDGRWRLKSLKKFLMEQFFKPGGILGSGGKPSNKFLDSSGSSGFC